MLERLASDKHFKLFGTSVSYEENEMLYENNSWFTNTGYWMLDAR